MCLTLTSDVTGKLTPGFVESHPLTPFFLYFTGSTFEFVLLGLHAESAHR